MIYLINQGVRQAAGWSRWCAGVGVEVAKLAALPSQQSVGEVSLNRAIIVGDSARFGGRAKARSVGAPLSSPLQPVTAAMIRPGERSRSSGRSSLVKTSDVALSVPGGKQNNKGQAFGVVLFPKVCWRSSPPFPLHWSRAVRVTRMTR